MGRDKVSSLPPFQFSSQIPSLLHFDSTLIAPLPLSQMIYREQTNTSQRKRRWRRRSTRKRRSSMSNMASSGK
ncbi:hypothetical protein AYX14_00188 [Cryptococcus neoformans]|nr:hypothetical protein C356_04106 [Cryptococcus neoformans var. grubii c45]OWZ68101.1 hypothetical protein AYX15_00926 [Cryptococcus neoformans var. grubii]OXC60430.1 hypothetical protein C358_04144 [Cryptococcus neoformans var. grubii MW-RSA852]OWZ74248.1 hypothetical protein AYX14_00188 [Cryptococcus neoformans var. grubii]OXB36269.1 hypothetical protein J007_04047 [Cryptococcus neoformans var. grubii]